MKTYIALDVGGTQIKASTLLESGKLLSPSITHYPSHSMESRSIILSHLYTIITNQFCHIPPSDMLFGIGIAFPGPFDYEQGISLIQGINKYDSIYNFNLKSYLLECLNQDLSIRNRLSPDFDIRFENDASLYALGETVLHNAPTDSKCLCVCIGTGLGSAFLDQGQLITNRADVPTNGWVYDTPFLDSIIDDYISARGIMGLYQEVSGICVSEVKPIAAQALLGDADALQTFHIFGERFANALEGFLENFKPTTLVIGGQISKSYPLFESHFTKIIKKQHPNLDIRLSADTSMSTLLGVIPLFL
ncbi:MAG: ROK family protein [Cellulosilyticaceae bacterium]